MGRTPDAAPAAVELEELMGWLESDRVADRLAALDRISRRRGRRIVPGPYDERAVGLLAKALGDPDRRVRRAAARGLRPWVGGRPELLDDVLPAYAGSTFDGGYTHLGLLDTRTGAIWIPRFAALKGHAALLRDGNTDWFLKFAFYIPGQAPPRLGTDAGYGHLVQHFIADWSYSRQELVPEFDERRRARALAEQERHAARVAGFYAACRLTYDVRVHRLVMSSGRRPQLVSDAGSIAAGAGE
jgi:hypothetical protein